MNLAALYPLVRPVLFALEAERAHDLTLENLRRAHGLGLDGAWRQPVLEVPRTVMGLRFPNPVGLAAGLDKDGRYIAALAELGFGFLEIGTVTPRAQPGNPKPRMFRLSHSQALINRMGFNNGGLDAFLKNIAAANFKGILGLNIGKNADTPIERAAEDYRACLSGVYAHASYVTVNVSSPNTKNLRQLQDTEALGELLGVLKGDQERLAQRHGRYVPLVLKVAPDLEPEAVRALARVAVSHRVDGLIATNTTVSRDAVAGTRHSEELGGLSGAPLRGLSDAVIRILRDELGGAIPIIGVGGILSGADARSKIEAGASLVQLYTGLIYRGPALIAESVKALREDGD